MYRFALGEDGRVDLAVEGEALLRGISVAARLRDGRQLELALLPIDTGTDSGEEVQFEDADGIVHARLKLVIHGGQAAVLLQADIRNKELFRDRVTFAPEHGVAVRLRELPGLAGLMANYQHKDWWTRPYFGEDPSCLPPRTQSLLWRTHGGDFRHLLPVCGDVFRADLQGERDGISCSVSAGQGGFTACVTTAFVVAAGSDPYALAEDNAAFALRAAGLPGKPRAEKSYPDVLEYLGWCSWDAFYHAVNAEGLVAKTRELADAGVPVRWVMIDDGWSEVSTDKRLRSYDADPLKFPDGLAPVIEAIKRIGGVRWVGVWHAIAGYWGGIDPDGELFAANRASLYRTNGGVWVPAPDAGTAFGFWNDWHGYLAAQGVDFVKVDSQSAILNFFRDLKPVGEAARAAHAALESSVDIHFGGCIINCMGMASENIWHRPSSSVSRNSDDFVPDEPYGFLEHAVQNGYNSFFHSPFYWGDWDMYWSDHHNALQNMVLRSVSGGPVYVSDRLGGTDPERILPLVYRDGRIIRCDIPGRPTADCLFTDPMAGEIPLKLWSRSGSAGVVAAFHVGTAGGAEVRSTIGPADVPGLQGDRFWLYDHFRQSLRLLAADERADLVLQPAGAELYLIVPDRGAVTPIGLADKLVSTHAILACAEEAGSTVVRLREGGKFIFAAPEPPERVTVNGAAAEAVPLDGRTGLYIVDCSAAAEETVVEIAAGQGSPERKPVRRTR